MFGSEYNGCQIFIFQDDYAENPRQWASLGTILSIDEANEASAQAVKTVRDDVNSGRSIERALKAQFPDMVWYHPIYRYTHGGSVWALHDNFPDRRWDVSQCGFVIVTRGEIKSWFKRQRMSQGLSDRIYNTVAESLKSFTKWANGDVWAFRVSGSGIIDLDDIVYGWYDSPQEALDNAEAMIDDMKESAE